MQGLEGQKLRKSWLPWPSLPRAVLSLQYLGCSGPRCSAQCQAQAQLRLWIKAFPRYRRRSLESSASLRTSLVSHLWIAAWNRWEGQSEAACSSNAQHLQFVVNLVLQDLPGALQKASSTAGRLIPLKLHRNMKQFPYTALPRVKFCKTDLIVLHFWNLCRH